MSPSTASEDHAPRERRAAGPPPAPWDLTDKTPLEPELPPQEDAFRRHIGSKQARKIIRRKEGEGSIWFGIGMFGVIGWSVAIPTVIGIGLGYLIDRGAPGRISWTLTLLVVGLCLGCLNAWYWVSRQRRAIEQRMAEVEAEERALQERAAQERTQGRTGGSGGPAGGDERPLP